MARSRRSFAFFGTTPSTSDRILRFNERLRLGERFGLCTLFLPESVLRIIVAVSEDAPTGFTGKPDDIGLPSLASRLVPLEVVRPLLFAAVPTL